MPTITQTSLIPFGQLHDTCYFGRHQVQSEEPWQIPCSVVHVDTNNQYLILMSDLIVDFRPFDAKESGGDSNRQSSGNNRWLYSNIRQWLNSSRGPGAWFEKQHSYDNPPNTSNVETEGTEYQNRPGFLYYFTTEERALLKASSIYTETSSTDGSKIDNDTVSVFLPSTKNLGAGGGASSDFVFQAYSGSSQEERIAHAHRMACENTGWTGAPDYMSPVNYWTRSPYASHSHDVQSVHTDGSLYDCGAYRGLNGVRPCFLITTQGGYVSTLDSLMVLPSASEISYLSPVRTLTGPAQNIIVAVDYVVSGSELTVFACNNAYDESPTWENVTEYVVGNSSFTLTNNTKTADNWGLQIKVHVDKSSAPYVSSRGIAYVVSE